MHSIHIAYRICHRATHTQNRIASRAPAHRAKSPQTHEFHQRARVPDTQHNLRSCTTAPHNAHTHTRTKTSLKFSVRRSPSLCRPAPPSAPLGQHSTATICTPYTLEMFAAICVCVCVCACAAWQPTSENLSLLYLSPVERRSLASRVLWRTCAGKYACVTVPPAAAPRQFSAK